MLVLLFLLKMCNCVKLCEINCFIVVTFAHLKSGLGQKKVGNWCFCGCEKVEFCGQKVAIARVLVSFF